VKDSRESDAGWWMHKVELLEKRLEELEVENFELKKTIRESIQNLQKHNSEMKESIKSTENILRPKFKKPKWERA